MLTFRANPVLDAFLSWKQLAFWTFIAYSQRDSLMITREYVTLFLVGSCFLLDYSSQISLQAPLQSRTKAGVMSVREGKGGKTARTPLRETSLTPLESRKRLRRHGRPRIHRIKRGWVWNQFFVLEEYMGSEPQYVGKVSEQQNFEMCLTFQLKVSRKESWHMTPTCFYSKLVKLLGTFPIIKL